MVKVDIILTFSKVLSFLIFVVGCIGYFFLHDMAILEMAIPVSAGLCGVKTFTSGWVQNNSNATLTDNQNINYTDSTQPNYRGISDS